MDSTRLQKLAGIPRDKRNTISEGMPGQDHEVKMAQQQLVEIAKHAIELSKKVVTMEKNLPGWIQDHISQSYNYIKQAEVGYHEL
jgi:hypothetical protein